MMKIFPAFCLLFISNIAWSQDYTSRIAKETCECFTKVKAQYPNTKNHETQLGVCMLKSVQPYAKEVKRDFNIDVINDDSEKTGGIIGKWLVAECPDIFLEMVSSTEDDKEIAKSQLLISGNVKKIEKGNFVIFHIVGENNNLTKFYWVSNIESNLDLPKEYNSLLNKKVNVSYYTTEIFDAKINDYRNLNIISGLKTDE